MLKSTLLILLAITLAYSLKWEGDNANGHPVLRTFTVLKDPAMGNPYTLTVLATQRSVDANGKKSKIQDAIEFSFSVIGLPHFVVRYFKRSTDGVEAVAVRHGLRKIIEYLPESGSSGFVPGVTTIVSEKLFWGITAGSTWSQLTIDKSTNSAGANIYSVCSSNDIAVTICLYLTDIWTSLTVNGSTFSIDPNAIHHSLDISNFPFKQNNTQLALKVHFEAVSAVSDWNDTSALDTNEDALDLADSSDGTNKAAASWMKTVNVTGTGCSPTAQVVRSVIYQNESLADIDINIVTALDKWTGEVDLTLVTRLAYFSFLTNCPAPTDIFWDPEIGVVDSTNSASVFFPVSLLLVILAMFL